MNKIFYEIASTITEWITGYNGTFVGIKGLVNFTQYLKVLEDVKLAINITTFVLITVFVVGSGLAAWNFIDRKFPN